MDSKKHKALNMVILYTEGCPATPKTIDLIEECISELGLRVKFKKIKIPDRDRIVCPIALNNRPKLAAHLVELLSARSSA